MNHNDLEIVRELRMIEQKADAAVAAKFHALSTCPMMCCSIEAGCCGCCGTKESLNG